MRNISRVRRWHCPPLVHTRRRQRRSFTLFFSMPPAEPRTADRVKSRQVRDQSEHSGQRQRHF